MNIDAQTVQDILIAIGLIGGIFVYAKGRIPQQTIKNLEESNKSYIELDKARQVSIRSLEQKVQEVVKLHTDERLQLTKDIADLQGQVKVYKELPLQELADGIKEVVKVSRDNASSNKDILAQLQKTAIIAAEDRDVLTNQDLHIKTEVRKALKSDERVDA